MAGGRLHAYGYFPLRHGRQRGQCGDAHMMGSFGQDLLSINWVSTVYSIAEIIMITMTPLRIIVLITSNVPD